MGFGVLSQQEAYSVSEAVEEAQWHRSVLAENVALCSSILEDSGGSLRRPIVTLSDSFNLCQAVKSDKGTGSDNRLRILTAMLRQVFCGAQGAALCFVTTATMLADALTKALVLWASLLAAMNARRHVFMTSESSTGVKTTLPMPSEPMPTLDQQNLLDALCLCVCGHAEQFVYWCWLYPWKHVSEIGIFVPSTSVFNIITVGHMKRI